MKFKIFIFIVFILLILFVIFLLTNKVRIKFKTFFKSGFAPKRGNFGLYCYTGSQGKGKTYSLIEYLLDNKNDIEVYCNIADIQGLDYTYFKGFDGLINIKHYLDHRDVSENKKQIVIVYDELFTELLRNSKVDGEVLDFLCQMRKREIIFLTTAQYWAELPITFRRFCRYQIDCNMFNFFGLGILIKRFNDAENMKWFNEEQEHIAPLLETTISKTRLSIANSYNTKLRIYGGLNVEEIKQKDLNLKASLKNF